MCFDLIGFKGITSNIPGTWIPWCVFRPTQISDLNNKIFFPKTKKKRLKKRREKNDKKTTAEKTIKKRQKNYAKTIKKR